MKRTKRILIILLWVTWNSLGEEMPPIEWLMELGVQWGCSGIFLVVNLLPLLYPSDGTHSLHNPRYLKVQNFPSHTNNNTQHKENPKGSVFNQWPRFQLQERKIKGRKFQVYIIWKVEGSRKAYFCKRMKRTQYTWATPGNEIYDVCVCVCWWRESNQRMQAKARERRMMIQNSKILRPSNPSSTTPLSLVPDNGHEQFKTSSFLVFQ